MGRIYSRSRRSDLEIKTENRGRLLLKVIDKVRNKKTPYR